MPYAQCHMPAAAPLTEAEVTSLLSDPMRIDGPVVWRQKSDDVWAETSLRVRHPQRSVDLRVTITVNLLAPSKFSVSLLANGARIRAFDAASSHGNKHTDTNQWRQQPHEHKWTDRCHGSWVQDAIDYPVELEQAFRYFCEKHGIDAARVKWKSLPPVQFGLEGL
jgi:hypothetical protein